MPGKRSVPRGLDAEARVLRDALRRKGARLRLKGGELRVDGARRLRAADLERIQALRGRLAALERRRAA